VSGPKSASPAVSSSVRSPSSLEGRTAVVLGGTSGIGRAISLGLAAAGADVVAAARRAEEVAETAAIEWGPRGVTVNAIAPGVFRTALNEALLDGTERGKEIKLRTPGGRFGKVEEVAGAAVFLASDAAGFVNGHILVVDGGYLASGVNQ
jgi:NAD(P)-dependent dehydrogenase (short-subunit alcohol dehydrogenase family)